MCNHQFIKFNDVIVCGKCGLTTTYDGKVIFDRKIPTYNQKRKKRGKK